MFERKLYIGNRGKGIVKSGVRTTQQLDEKSQLVQNVSNKQVRRKHIVETLFYANDALGIGGKWYNIKMGNNSGEEIT